MISKHVNYSEVIRSSTASKLNIDNTPNEKELLNIRTICELVFEPLREYIGKPIRINSFFRSKALNTVIGGSKYSQHCKGEAMDLYCFGENKKMYDYIDQHLDYDQLIWEYGNDNEPDWVHVSFTDERLNRRQKLRAIRGVGYVEI